MTNPTNDKIDISMWQHSLSWMIIYSDVRNLLSDLGLNSGFLDDREILLKLQIVTLELTTERSINAYSIAYDKYGNLDHPALEKRGLRTINGYVVAFSIRERRSASNLQIFDFVYDLLRDDTSIIFVRGVFEIGFCDNCGSHEIIGSIQKLEPKSGGWRLI